MDERRFRSITPSSLEKVQRSSRIRVKIIEYDLGGAIVRWLRRGMDNHAWPGVFQKLKYARSISYIQIVVLIPAYLITESSQRPGCISLRTKEHGALVIVDAENLIADLVEMNADLRTNQSARTGD